MRAAVCVCRMTQRDAGRRMQASTQIHAHCGDGLKGLPVSGHNAAEPGFHRDQQMSPQCTEGAVRVQLASESASVLTSRQLKQACAMQCAGPGSNCFADF